MDALLYDFRAAARGVLDAALFALAILGLVVGIGAGAAFLSAAGSCMRPLVADSADGRLVDVAAPAPASCPTLMSSPDFLDYQVAAVAGECSRS
ncbi:MAG TPA: hypothetical protein VGR27_05720 [Longimicrobiaceae bacterium]|nr:hypothetical protein [Longimicrobiaceae bacterium]